MKEREAQILTHKLQEVAEQFFWVSLAIEAAATGDLETARICTVASASARTHGVGRA